MPYPDDDTPLLLLLTLASRHLVDGLQAHLVAAGFEDHRAAHHNVMAHATFEGVRLTELAEKAGVTKQAMSELVADLERRGYVERVRDPSDGRAKLIRIAARGALAVDTAMKAFDRLEAAIADRIGSAALAEVKSGLLGVIDTPLPPPLPPSGRRQRRRRTSR